MRRQRPLAFEISEQEMKITNNIRDLLGGFSPVSFEDHGEWIAPFVVAGTALPDTAAERQRLIAPLTGPRLRLMSQVTMNTRVGSGVSVPNMRSPKTAVYLGAACRAIRLGQSPAEDPIFLTERGYIGEALPKTPINIQDESLADEYRFPLRTFSDSLNDWMDVQVWQTNYSNDPANTDFQYPVVALHPDRHIGKFPELFMHAVGGLLEKLQSAQ